MKPRCSDCKHWHYDKGDFGFCRRNAPHPSVLKGSHDDQYILVWPSTGRNDYCGEFKVPVRKKEKK